MMNHGLRRALSMREVLIIIACVVVLLVLASMFLIGAASKARRNAMLMYDSSQLRGIHQSWLVFSREFNGVYPTPGLVSRLPDPVLGVSTPGRGPEDISRNTTANLFSLCLSQNYFRPEICVGTTEPSSHVKPFDEVIYDIEAYQTASGDYWDKRFKADLHDVSNVSYAHMPLFGDAKQKQWRDTADGGWAVLGNRGPRGGIPDPNSITNKIHTPFDRWSGYIIYNDGHSEFTEKFPIVTRFDENGNTVTDAAITFTKEIVNGVPVFQHD